MIQQPRDPLATSLRASARLSHKIHNPRTGWECLLELRADRTKTSGSERALGDAIERGSDLRIGTAFRHNEHVDEKSSCDELIQEFVDFRVTYLLENRWVAGICNLRMPVELPDGFGERESMSLFLYNQNAQQAVARLHLAKPASTNDTHSALANDDRYAPRYRTLDSWDEDTNAPSSNFIYDFDYYRYCVHDRWTQVLEHDAEGTVVAGSKEDLAEAFRSGAELKVAIRGLSDDLRGPSDAALDHEVFVHVGSTYYYTERKLLIGATHPVVRVRPAIPLVYQSGNWDFGWLLAQTDGCLARWLCNPYTLKFQKSKTRHAMRWFVGV